MNAAGYPMNYLRSKMYPYMRYDLVSESRMHSGVPG